MDEIANRGAAPAGWLEALERGETEVAAGQTVSAEVVHQHLREGLARLEARLARRQKREGAANS